MQYILVTHKTGPNLLPPPNYCLEISQNSVIQSTHCKCLLCTSTYCKLVQMCNQALFCHIQGIDLRNPAITVEANVELFYFLLEHPQQLLYLCLLQYLHIQDTVRHFSPPESSLFTHSSERTWCFSELGRKIMNALKQACLYMCISIEKVSTFPTPCSLIIVLFCPKFNQGLESHLQST
jgi:hypothetical protein